LSPMSTYIYNTALAGKAEDVQTALGAPRDFFETGPRSTEACAPVSAPLRAAPAAAPRSG
jgi:hypothetical protein